jgi:hypothetical protein
VIKVGAATEIEMKEKKARVEDALHATRAAVEEGVVPGGGVALIRALKALEKLEGANEDQTVGIRILARSIEEPLRQIVENAGEDAAVILNEVKGGKGAYGYNAATGEYGDMLEDGHPGPDQGHASRAAERGVGRGPAADDRSDDRRGAEGRSRPWPPGSGRHGRHGRQLLQDDAGDEHRVTALQGGAQGDDRRRPLLAIATERERPDTGVDQQRHRRERSDL